MPTNPCFVATSLLLAVAAIILQNPVQVAWRNLGLYREITPVRRDYCHRLRETKACPSMYVRNTAGTAYLACHTADHDRATRKQKWLPEAAGPEAAQKAYGQDKIFSYIFELNEASEIKLSGFEDELRIMSIGGCDYDIGIVAFLILNKRHNETTVEVFKHSLGSSNAEFVETIRDVEFVNVVDVLPITPKSFYLTVDHSFEYHLLRSAERVLPLPTGKILFRTEKGKVKTVASGLRSPRGIAMDLQTKHIHVAEMTQGGIATFERSEKSGNIRKIDFTPIGMMVDKVQADGKHGLLYVSTIPNPLKLVEHLKDEKQPSPSMILRLGKPSDENQFYGRRFEITPVFASDDTQASTANSIGAHDDRTMIVSTVLGSETWICPLPDMYERQELRKIKRD